MNVATHILTILFLFSGVCFAEPCVFPLQHWVHYQYDADKPDDIMAGYMRIDSGQKITDGYYEYTGQFTPMTVRGSFTFLHQNWTKPSGPNLPATNYWWFSTFSRNYRGGLPSVSLRQPAEPNEPVVQSLFFVSATSKPDADYPYHGKWCRYVNENSVPIKTEDIERYRPCTVCTPDNPEVILKNLLPVDVLAEIVSKED